LNFEDIKARNSGHRLYLNYYRGKDVKEIDLLWLKNGTLYPLEIKTLNSNARLSSAFKVLEKLIKSGSKMGLCAFMRTLFR